MFKRTAHYLSNFSTKVSAGVMLAQALPTTPPTGSGLGGLYNPATGMMNRNTAAASSGATFLSYFITIWRALIAVGGLLVIFYFVSGAIDWISAGGDSGKVQKARDKMTQAVIGLVVLVGSFFILDFISRLFFGDNFNLLRLTFPTP